MFDIASDTMKYQRKSRHRKIVGTNKAVRKNALLSRFGGLKQLVEQ
jgi:hypothetical protein